MSPSLIEQKQSGKACHHNHLDGIDLIDFSAYEGSYEEGNADGELPCVGLGGGEVLAVAEQQSGCSQQSHHSGAQAREDGLHGGGVHVFDEQLGDDNHQDE